MPTHRPRLFYLSYTRFPSERAHAVYLAKVCEAFGKLGIETTLVVPQRFKTIKADPFAYYGISNTFSVRRIPSIDLFPFIRAKGLASRIGTLSFALGSVCSMLLRARREDLVLTNDPLLVRLLPRRCGRVVWEVHDYPERIGTWYRTIAHRATWIMANNEQKARSIPHDFRVSSEKVFAEHNGVDLHAFSGLPDQAMARATLNLPHDRPIALYTGNLLSWKGVDTLAEAASLMSEVEVYVVGGSEAASAEYRARYQDTLNLTFVPNRPHHEIPLWLAAADVLVLPNTGTDPLSTFHTSPMKLFEYLASGRPIVASDIPTVRELVDEKVVAFFEPDTPSALAKGITGVILNGGRDNWRTRAKEIVRTHTWEARATRICDKIGYR